MVIPNPYFTILVKWEKYDLWSSEFGSYNPEEVEEELESEYKENCYNWRVIVTDGDQKSINSIVSQMNACLTN